MSPAKETKQITDPTGDTDKPDTQTAPPDDSGITVNQPVPPPEPKRVAADEN